MKPMRDTGPFLLLMAALSLGAACSSRHYLDVTPEQFEAAYAIPITFNWNTEYYQDERCHFLDYYAQYTKSWPEYEFTLRTPKSACSDAFPVEARIQYLRPLSEEQQAQVDARLKEAFPVLEATGMFQLRLPTGTDLP